MLAHYIAGQWNRGFNGHQCGKCFHAMTLSWLRKDMLLSMESFPLNNMKNRNHCSHPCFHRPCYHDDAIKWKYFPCYWPPVNPPITGALTKANAVTGIFLFSLNCASTNGWANNRDTGDLARHRAYYDVTVMTLVTMDYSTTWTTTVGFRYNAVQSIHHHPSTTNEFRWLYQREREKPPGDMPIWNMF